MQHNERVIFYLSLHGGTKQVTVVGKRWIQLWPQATGKLPKCFTFHNSNDKTSPLYSNGNQYHGWKSFWLHVKLGRCQLQCIASNLIFIWEHTYCVLIRTAVFCQAGLDTTTQHILTTNMQHYQEGPQPSLSVRSTWLYIYNLILICH